MPPVHRFEKDGVEMEEFEAQVSVLNVPVALGRGSNLPVARDEALQEMLTFLVDLIAKKASHHVYEPLPPQSAIAPREEAHQPPSQAQQPSDRPPVDSYHDDDTASVRSYSEDQNMDDDGRYMEREPDLRGSDESRNVYLKRRYEPSREDRADEPISRRQRVEDSGSGSQNDRQPTGSQANSSNFSSSARAAESSAPMFFVDNAGECKPHADRTSRALTESERIQKEVEGYRELVAQMFKNRDRVMEKLDRITWDTTQEVEVIEFDSKLMVSRLHSFILPIMMSVHGLIMLIVFLYLLGDARGQVAS